MDTKKEQRICPQCEARVGPKSERCPKCGSRLERDLDENLSEKTSADSFPASDPPSY